MTENQNHAVILLILTAFFCAALSLFFLPDAPQKEPKIRPSVLANAAHKALINAANKHKISPHFLLGISYIETGGKFSTSIRPRRKNGQFIGTARGLCQFIKKTAKAYKLDWATNDPKKQANTCAKLLKDNRRVLRARLRRKPSHGEIYLAHVFGAGKAVSIALAPSDKSVIDTVGKRALNANRFLARYKNAGGIRRWAERKIRRAKKKVARFITQKTAKK